MFVKLLILFTVVPIVEIFLLVKTGQAIGTWYTMAIVIITGATGASFAKSQGLKVFREIRLTFNSGQIPGRELVQAAMVLAGGIMLLTPGFITDITGFSLLIPYTRNLFTDWGVAYFKKKIQARQWQASAQYSDNGGYYYKVYTEPPENDNDHQIIDHPKLEE